MSLIRQIWLLLLATVLLAFVGSVTVAVESARGYLRDAAAAEERRQRHLAGAGAVAAEGRPRADEPADVGAVRHRLLPPHPLRRRRRPSSASSARPRRRSPRPTAAPAWFAEPGADRIGARPRAGVRRLARARPRRGRQPQSPSRTTSCGTAACRPAIAMAVVGLLAGLHRHAGRAAHPQAARLDGGQAQALVDGEFIKVSRTRRARAAAPDPGDEPRWSTGCAWPSRLQAEQLDVAAPPGQLRPR